MKYGGDEMSEERGDTKRWRKKKTQKDEARNQYDSRKEKVVTRKKVDLKTSIHELQMRPFSSARIPI